MAKRRAKKQEQSHSEGFLEALNEVCKERDISPDVIFDALEAALITAYKRNFQSAQNVHVMLDRLTGDYHVYAIKDVVDEVYDDITQISVGQAKAIDPEKEIGDTVEIEVTPRNFGRVAAQTAKQVVVQHIREAERGMIYDEFSSREGDTIVGRVERVEPHGVYIDLGRTEAVLPISEQIPGEKFEYGSRIRAYVAEVRRTTRGPQIVISRTHPGLLKRLFELEVPEIHDGTVEIKSVAREPGMRSKIAVWSNDEAVDPVGSCVGHKGMRVQNIVDELRGEKIDIVKWNEDPAKYIANALSPAQAISVAVNEEEKVSRVVVPDGQLSLAIGKEGQNARLAAKLTNWKIDIKSESQAGEDDIDDSMDVVEVEGSEGFSADSPDGYDSPIDEIADETPEEDA